MRISNIILSPYARWIGDKSRRNAKDYPYMQSLVSILTAKGHKIIQVGVGSEPKILGCEYVFDLPLKDLEEFTKKVGYFLAVDNFFHHMAYCLRVPGIVLWGPSDSRLFGYEDQRNIGNGREYLRSDQFGFYHLDWVWPHERDGWLDAETVYEKMKEVL